MAEVSIRLIKCQRCGRMARKTPVYIPFIYGRRAVSYHVDMCKPCYLTYREELNAETRQEQENVDPFSYFDR